MVCITSRWLLPHIHFWIYVFCIGVVLVALFGALFPTTYAAKKKKGTKKNKNKKTRGTRGLPCELGLPSDSSTYLWWLNHFWVFLLIGSITGYPWWEGPIAGAVWELIEFVLAQFPLLRPWFKEHPTKSLVDIIIDSIGFWIGIWVIHPLLPLF